MKKIILCDGDSWTSGDIVDPNIFGDKLEHVNHPKNTEYRLPRVWPGKLEKLIGIETDNISIAGSSNDAIVRRTLRRVIQLLETYKPEEIFVIIGWSSPERKLLHNFLKSKGIKHLFFDAFYEKEDGMFKDVDIEETFYNFHFLRSDKIGGDRIRELEFSGNKYLIDEFLKLREKIFKKESFRRYIGFKDMKLWDGVHPSEEAHEKWAQELNRELRGKI